MIRITHFSLVLTVLLNLGLSAQTVLLSENFETTEFPENWDQQTNASDGGWLLGVSTSLESEYWTIAPHGNFIATNDDDCDCDKELDYLIMPSLDLTSSVQVVLQFENYFDGGTLFGGTEIATIEYSLNSGISWTILEEIEGTEDNNWDTQSIDLSSLSGNPDVLIAFHYYDDNNWLFGWGIDDVIVFEPEGLDLGISSLDVPNIVDAPSNLIISGTVTNNGLEEINSFDLSWTIGGADNSTTINELSITSLESYTFSHPVELEVISSGTLELTVSISNINGMLSDLNPLNNEWTGYIQAVEYGELIDDGINREYIYYHPESAPDLCPLVFVCHGYTGSAQGIMDYSEFNAVADEFGFAVCYPQGIDDSFGNTFFNVGYDFQNGETVDDVAFIQNLSSFLHSNYSLSESDIFCTGLSNGGDFCYMLACQASTQFKAVAPVAGMILQDIMDDCNPESEVSIFEIHGTNDNVTYFEGDPDNIDEWGAYPSIPATIDFWTTLYGLDILESVNIPDSSPGDGSTITSDVYTENGSCTEVWLYTVEGGGHDWPGAFGNMDISASREIWTFFEGLCDSTVGMEDHSIEVDRTLVQITDILGREVKEESNVLLLYLYSDGSVEKRFCIE
ncbi:MAG: polyhydroxybutyrate depolymerase [Litorivivens sp.]|jgi:polyhydroxybutyrate depolymerase